MIPERLTVITDDHDQRVVQNAPFPQVLHNSRYLGIFEGDGSEIWIGIAARILFRQTVWPVSVIEVDPGKKRRRVFR